MSHLMDSQFVFVDRCRQHVESGSTQTQHVSPDLNTFGKTYRQRAKCQLLASSIRPGIKQTSMESTNEQPSRESDRSNNWLGSSADNLDVENYTNGNQNSEKLAKRRTSLHGKTITVRVSRNETKYRKFQAQTYNFLERPKTWPSIAYHVFVFASVFGCLILSVLSTIKDYTVSAGRILLYMELAILFWFFTEYCIRLWSAGCRSRYQTWRGRIQFAQRPFCIVDIIVIVASVVVLAVDSDRNMFAASALRGLRFFQILRMIRMDRRGGSFKLLASVVWAHRQELFTTVYIGFLGLIFSSFLIYLVEKKENDKIKTYADALWWGVVTLCTVGYGDTVPRTWIGKIIAAFCSLAGISFFALPAGILGSGFALKVQQHQRQKHLIRRRVPAATLIQCLWRCYAADPHSSSVATWKLHTRPVRKPVGLTASSSVIERGGFSRFGRFSTLKRRPDKTPQPITSGGTVQSIDVTKQLDEKYENGSNGPKSAPILELPSDPTYILTMESKLEGTMETVNKPTYEGPLFGNTKKDKDAQTPVAQIKDHNELIILPGTRSRQTIPQINYPHSTRSSINRSQALTMHESGPNNWSTNPYTNSSRERSPVTVDRQLTEREKMAIRTIRKMRFLVARRKFREALRPYDVKDVIEQYSAGHLDMLTRVKILQSRLDQILGRQGSKADDVYDSHQSLASRIVKIEHKIDAVEMKIDRLSSMYKTDRMGRLPLMTTDYCMPDQLTKINHQYPYFGAGPLPSSIQRCGTAPQSFLAADLHLNAEAVPQKCTQHNLRTQSPEALESTCGTLKRSSWDVVAAIRPTVEMVGQTQNLPQCSFNRASEQMIPNAVCEIVTSPSIEVTHVDGVGDLIHGDYQEKTDESATTVTSAATLMTDAQEEADSHQTFSTFSSDVVNAEEDLAVITEFSSRIQQMPMELPYQTTEERHASGSEDQEVKKTK